MKQLVYLSVLALVLAPAFGGCRSKPKSRCGTGCTPPTAQAPFTPEYIPPQAPDITAGVPAPTPAPGPTLAEIDLLHDQIATEQETRAALERDKAEARLRLIEAEDEIERLKGALAVEPAPAPAPEPVYPAATPATDFADRMRATGALEVVNTGDTVTLRLSDAFRPGSDKLRGDTRLLNALRRTADALTGNAAATIAVVGHSDTTPIKKSPWANNTALSLARAKTVAGLLADAGVQASRIAVDGRGEFEPLVTPERTSGDRATNRRVEIEVRF